MTFTERLAGLWRRIPKPLRSGWITAWITFVSTMLTILVGLLPELANAITTRNVEPFYDSLSLNATAAVSAVTGFLAGVVNAIYRWARPIEQAYRSDAPADDGDRGAADVTTVLIMALVAFVVVVIVLWAR